MPTNGRRKTAASSHALNVGAQMPTSGERASPTPAAVPPSPLTSAYVRTALMKETPTSGPIAARKTHHARETRSSCHSFWMSQSHVCLGERKECLLQILGARRRAQFAERALAANAPTAQE